jgi:hypothetical protein
MEQVHRWCNKRLLEIVLSLMSKVDMIVTIMDFIDITGRGRLTVLSIIGEEYECISKFMRLLCIQLSLRLKKQTKEVRPERESREFPCALMNLSDDFVLLNLCKFSSLTLKTK